MTWMFEVYYLPPTDPAREARLSEVVGLYHGWLDYKEAPEIDDSHNVCLTFEFNSLSDAKSAAEHVRSLREYVEGPGTYT